MNLREKLLLKLAQDPTYEGKDETEKALVAELKADMEAEKGVNPVDADVKAAAKELAAEVIGAVKGMFDEMKKGDDTPERKAVKDNPQGGRGDDFDTEVKAAAEKQGVKVESEKAMKEFKKAYRFAEYVKSLADRDFARTKALAEGTDELGGFLVPDEFRADLIQHIMQTDTIRKFATVIPMEGKLLTVPKLTADVKVYWGTENQSISTTSADFGEVTLTPFRLNAIIYTSRELFDDSAISITEILRQRFTDRVADEENKVFLGGDGTTQPKGINQETFRSIDAGNALSPEHLTRAYWKLPKAYRSSSRWLLNSRTMERLENSRDTNGAFLYPSLQGEVQTLKGRPILVDDYQPSSKVILGDLSYYYIGDRQQMTMDVTMEAGTTWEKYQMGIRVVERVDGEVALTNAFVQINNTGIA